MNVIDYQGEDRAPGWMLRKMQDQAHADLNAVDNGASVAASLREAMAAVLIDHLYPIGEPVTYYAKAFVAGVWRDVERKFQEEQR